MNLNFKKIELNSCTNFPKDKVNIPSLIEDLNFIKEKRPLLYNELKELRDENNNLFNLEDNSKENIANIQRRYFTVKAYEHLEKRFITNEISEEAKPYYLERFKFELTIINDMKFDGYTLLVSDFLSTLNIKLGGLIGPGRGCLTKEALVYTYNNDVLETKQIDNIIKGDKVITHNNLIKEVTETFVYDIEEDLLEIETFHSDKLNPIILTKDHKVYCGNNVWKQAKNITTKDYLYLPIPKYKEIKINSWDMTLFSEFTKEKNYILENEYLTYKYSQNVINDFSIKYISNKLKMSKETINKFINYLKGEKTNITEKTVNKISDYILKNFNNLNEWLIYVENLNTKKIKKELVNSFYFRKFLGRWIGDGSIRKNLNRECVNLVFNKNDNIGIIETLEFIKENNYKHSISFKKSICSIDILDSYLHSFIKTIFNDYKFESNSKYFPEFVFNLPKNEIKDIIDGYVAADGYIDKNTNRIKTATVSKRLAYELKTLLLQIGVPSTIAITNRKQNNNHIKLKIGNKEYRNEFPAIKTLHNIPLCNPNIYEIEENEYIKLRVRKIKNKKQVKTQVYDFTVEDDHSYTTTNFIVHNSAAGSLVSWAYGITNVDPMLHYKNSSSHLLFERYLNPERISLPDIDMDMNGLINKDTLLNKIQNENIDSTIINFIDIIKTKYENDEVLDGKGLIEDYQVALYGKNKVAKIVTRDTYQAKSAIAVVCKYLGNDFAESSGFKFKGTPYIEFASRISGNAFTKAGVGFKDIFDENSKFYNQYFINLYSSNYHVKKVVDLARKLEGTIANYGVHAAGVLLLDPKNNYLNDGYMVIGGTNVSVLDGKHVEDYINIKFDFLGLASLEEIDKTLKFIEEKNGKELRDEVFYKINNENLLYNDITTFENVFDTQNTKKIFQFSSDGMQDLVKRVEPKCFEDLVAITALYRPGPMESGMVDMYVKNKKEPENVFVEFEELRSILEPTYFTIVYQEQVMKIVQVLGGFSLGGADLVRRAMGKKIKEELDKLKDQFIEGTVKTYEGKQLTLNTLEKFGIFQEYILYYDGENILFKSVKEMNDLGLDEKFTDKEYGRLILKKGTKLNLSEDYITRLLANNLFEQIVKFAGYGFNKSHAYAYTNVSMQMAYLKAHYPLEFFASILFNNSDDIEKLSEYIIDAKKNNIEVIGANINLSNFSFSLYENKIIYGLSNIKGISNKDIKKILEDRNINGYFKDLGDFLIRFIIKNNGSIKTLENLIYSGILDSLEINNNKLEEFFFLFNLNKININEDIEIYLNRISNKKEYLKTILSLDGLYDDNLNVLNNISKIFDIEINDNLLPLIVEKLLKSKKSTIEKLFNNINIDNLDISKTKEYNKAIKDLEKNKLVKEKFINEIKEHNEYLNQIKSNINFDLIKDNVESKRVFLLNLIDVLETDKFNDKSIESINKNISKYNSIIYLANIEFENTGSLSNFGSILNRDYVFENFEHIPKLNMLLEPFKIDGVFEYKATIKDIISGVNEENEAYMSLSILDINCLEHKLYFTQDQIFRYKNNLSIGDPIILEIEIKENKDKFYKKLINMIVFKNKKNQWINEDVFKLPLISIKDLDKDKIRKKISLKTEFCSLDEIKNDWIKSEKNWPGIEEGNKKVVLILVAYKNITTKDGREFQILELSDGIGYETIELLYSKLNLETLENSLRKPIVIELGKRVDNGYGISAAYKSEVIFLDDSYILKSKEERYEYSENVNELLDGKEHINVYTRGRTNLGRLLSNFSDIPTKVIHQNKLYEFKTLEGYWYFLKLFMLTGVEHFEFLTLNGYQSKEIGSNLSKGLDKFNEEQEIEFRHKIKLSLYSKIFGNETLINLMKENKLPYLHYYNYNGRIRVLPEFDWLLDIINDIGKEIQKTI